VPPRRTISRQPSCLISCTQSGPEAGLATRVGMQGFMKPSVRMRRVAMAASWRLAVKSSTAPIAARLNRRLGGHPLVIRALDANPAKVGLPALLIAGVTAGD
jgi:hypothetical protein